MITTKVQTAIADALKEIGFNGNFLLYGNREANVIADCMPIAVKRKDTTEEVDRNLTDGNGENIKDDNNEALTFAEVLHQYDIDVKENGFVIVSPYAEGTLNFSQGVWHNNTTLPLYFCALMEQSIIDEWGEDAKVAVRTRINDELVRPFIVALNRSGKFDKITSVTVNAGISLFDAREVHVLARFSLNYRECDL